MTDRLIKYLETKVRRCRESNPGDPGAKIMIPLDEAARMIGELRQDR